MIWSEVMRSKMFGLTIRHLRQKDDYSSRRQKAKVTQVTFKSIEKLWAESILAFVDTASDNTSVDTGMSVQSLVPTAQKVSRKGKKGFPNVVNKINQLGREPAPPLYTLQGNKVPKGKRSMGKGHYAGKKAFHIKFGSHRRPNLRFSYDIMVWQFLLMETGSHASGWKKHHTNALEKGREAMLNYFHDNFKNIVKVQEKNLIKYLLTGTFDDEHDPKDINNTRRIYSPSTSKR